MVDISILQSFVLLHVYVTIKYFFGANKNSKSDRISSPDYTFLNRDPKRNIKISKLQFRYFDIHFCCVSKFFHTKYTILLVYCTALEEKRSLLSVSESIDAEQRKAELVVLIEQMCLGK